MLYKFSLRAALCNRMIFFLWSSDSNLKYMLFLTCELRLRKKRKTMFKLRWPCLSIKKNTQWGQLEETKNSLGKKTVSSNFYYILLYAWIYILGTIFLSNIMMHTQPFLTWIFGFIIQTAGLKTLNHKFEIYWLIKLQIQIVKFTHMISVNRRVLLLNSSSP